MWHRFSPESADESRCSDPDCGIVVDDTVLELLTTACPAGPCEDGGNVDLGCRFVPDDDGEPVCAYCEAPGSSGA